MKRIMLFLTICSFHFQIFANGTCQNITLQDIDITPNLNLLDFVHEEEGKENTVYTIEDIDRALSLLALVNLYLQEEGPPENAFKDLLSNLAEKLIKSYNDEIEELREQPLADDIIGARIDIASGLLADNLSYEDLNNFYNELINHTMYYFGHKYRTHYYTHDNQNTDEHFSSRYVTTIQKLELAETTTIEGVYNPIGYHIMSKCPLQGNLGDLL